MAGDQLVGMAVPPAFHAAATPVGADGAMDAAWVVNDRAVDGGLGPLMSWLMTVTEYVVAGWTPSTVTEVARPAAVAVKVVPPPWGVAVTVVDVMAVLLVWDQPTTSASPDWCTAIAVGVFGK